MQLIIKGLKGSQDTVDIHDDATVLDLKAVIMSQLGHPASNQKLLYKGKILEDSKMLVEYHMKDRDPIVMMITKSQEQTAYEKSVQELIKLGFDRDEIEAALKATDNNIEAALRYLSGADQIEDEDDDEEMEENENLLLESAGKFGFLLNSEEFMRIREILRTNPNEFEPMMQQLETQNPELYELIKNNTDEFLNLVGLRLASRPEIELSSQEETDVKELCELGFATEDVVEAYVACDKNKELAASYLFENYQQNFD
jgi:Holliday junction resolvasome RuvABC DNA-binding subunit